jgi:hypothetical protein
MGCRNAHLGPGTGDSYRDAMKAQRASEAKPPAPLDASDSNAVLRTHRAGKKDSKVGRSSSSVSTSSSSSGSPDSRSDSGSFGPAGREIRLDAR